MVKAVIERRRHFGPWRSIGVTLAGAIMLAGCQSAQNPEFQQTGSLRAFRSTDRHPILVEPGEAQLQIDVPGYARGLTPGQAEQVRAFLSDYRSLGEGEIVVTVPSGTANEASAVAAVSDVRHLIGDARIAKTAVRYAPYRGADAGGEPPIMLSFGRYYATPSECGYWPRNIAHEPYNKPYANFGCASQNNLAAMVADPRDLVRARALTEGDAARRYEVFDQYRRGKVTSADRSAAESATVSEVE